ncbi:YceI family protein [Emticicia agri]|uniref:Polyisoprenoid-binding protein n=1 Tax=Emticicia agri TaxID=2492393 RepID=A0A4Q5M2F5_9BACT|nr:YceI family protein [Emticicia agri]RYU96458.1 polyisoprenoid-binding protein [Emticicia agri]
MKKAVVLVLSLLASVSSFAQTWSVDKAHAKVNFTVTHLMLSEVDGTFKSFDAKLTSSKEDFSDAVFEFTIDAKSVNTNQENRDAHLNRADMFDTEKYPTITYKSTAIKPTGPKKFQLTGDLTIKGVTKPVTVDLTLVGTGQNRQGKKLVGFKASGTINRTAFGVGAMPAAVVSEEVELRASGEFVAN